MWGRAFLGNVIFPSKLLFSAENNYFLPSVLRQVDGMLGGAGGVAVDRARGLQRGDCPHDVREQKRYAKENISKLIVLIK